MKIVKNTKVIKMPSNKGSVISTFRRAQKVSQEQEWSKIIITGVGKNGRAVLHSYMSVTTGLGLLEITKDDILRDL